MNRFIVILLAMVIIVGIAYSGFYFGTIQGEKKGSLAMEMRLAPLLNNAYPRPADDIRFLDGIVKSVSGSKIDLEIDNIDDYIPHLDGTSRLKDTRYVVVSDKTKITLVDLGNFTSSGQPQRTAIKLSDVKSGMSATVRSATNVRNLKTFDATDIEVIK